VHLERKGNVMKRLLVVLAVLGLLASAAEASVLPSLVNQKYEASLDGFGYLRAQDPDGTPGNGDEYLVLRNMIKVDSPIKAQGDITTATDEPPGAPDRFAIGYDNGIGGRLSNPASDVSVPGILGVLISGLKVIAVDDDTGTPFLPGPYNRITGDANILAWALGAGNVDQHDIVYFGDDPEVAGAPKVRFWHDTEAGNDAGDFGPGFDGWSMDGDLYTNSLGQTFGNDGADTLVLDGVLLDQTNYQVDGLARAAPAGTLVASVTDNNGIIRPLAFIDVIGGVDAYTVLPGGMYANVYTDPDGDGDMTTGASHPQVTQVADFVSAIASQPLPNGFSQLSDPTEWVGAIPEPGSVVVWGALSLVGLGYCLVRRRGRK
jgi:hypothetical protein